MLAPSNKRKKESVILEGKKEKSEKLFKPFAYKDEQSAPMRSFLLFCVQRRTA